MQQHALNLFYSVSKLKKKSSSSTKVLISVEKFVYHDTKIYFQIFKTFTNLKMKKIVSKLCLFISLPS